MTKTGVEQHITQFLTEHHPDKREASFDYCYNYFQSFREQGRLPELLKPQHLQEACLQIGFYLASWGMYRGKAFLLQRSARHYLPLIRAIVEMPAEVWDIDTGQYTAEHIQLLQDCEKRVAEALAAGEFTPTLTLTTKVMLGIFGNVPAIDTYVFEGIKAATGVSSWNLNTSTLTAIQQFYLEHQATFDDTEVHTLDFLSGQPTPRRYSRAKLVDMALFMAGQNKAE